MVEPESTRRELEAPRYSSKYKKRLTTVVVVAAILSGLWQIDLVRQNAQIAWLHITGKAWRLRGHVAQLTVWSPSLGQSRIVYVYTPPDYRSSTAGTRFPVLYLLHGSPGLPTDWIRYGRAPEEVERLHAAGRAPEMIVVCPDGHGIGLLGDSEYLDAPTKEVQGAQAGIGTNVASFIVRDLVSWTDSHYSTKQDAADRILAGVSTGGYGAVNLALQHSDIFGGGLSFSGYFTADQYGWARPVWGHHPTKARLDAESPTVFVKQPEARWADSFVYVGDGLDERPPYPQQSALFVTKLTNAHIQFVHRRMPGRHSWDLWRGQLSEAIADYETRRIAPDHNNATLGAGFNGKSGRIRLGV